MIRFRWSKVKVGVLSGLSHSRQWYSSGTSRGDFITSTNSSINVLEYESVHTCKLQLC